ncbi:SpaA isopeptide-forming pilin-related protein [Floccifex porci]|uniref:Isopeptide-forming domain-containing fimbrial protein n=1 Tax=Floccifex porci TaxID=2606629 RepID=A0A7X2N3Y7_9FIRM|nr:SpaA isopeptide-forming pilin-related protein [Floccifex porci]MSS01995.1 isopeptide-forming domain-containing fimbrial protein [Floccifex porci]
MKKKNIIKKIAIASTLQLSLGGCILNALNTYPICAYENINTVNGIVDYNNGQAKIRILPNGNQSLVSKQFAVYKLFQAQISNTSINYFYNEEYKDVIEDVVSNRLNKDSISEYEVIDYIQSLEDHSSSLRELIEEIRDQLVSQGYSSDTFTVTNTLEDGSIEIQGLQPGYYMIDEITSVQDTHSAASLILLDTADDSCDIQIKSDYPSIIKKIEEDDLNIGWNDIGDYEIGQSIPYKYETYIPDIKAYNTYKMIFHDIMDEALTFDSDSVQIQISDSEKTYTVPSNQYSIVENTDNESFIVQISDIKSIIDQQFSNGYGQKVLFTYNAYLNEKAKDRSGRAGFENKVALEFSNNPDTDGTNDTGMTPWDSVVCFTYQINAVKTNEENQSLQGAKFRLYRDENGTQEIKLKKVENVYVVMNEDYLSNAESDEMISDENGLFNISGLDQGTYYLKETQAPDGYRKIQDSIKIVITPEFTTDRNSYYENQGASDQVLETLSANCEIKQFLNGLLNSGSKALQTDVQTGSIQLKIVNQTGSKLPVTGSSMTLILLAGGSLLMIAGLYNLRKQKNEKLD